jgi:hypothetical protein
MFSACTIHALVAAPEVNHLGGVAAAETSRCSSRPRCERCARGSARWACEACVEIATCGTSAQAAIRRLGPPGSPRGDRSPVSPRWRRTHDAPHPLARDAQRCSLPGSELDRADLGGELVDPTASHTADLGRLGDGQQRRQGIQPSNHPDCSIPARRPRGLSSRCARRIGDDMCDCGPLPSARCPPWHLRGPGVDSREWRGRASPERAIKSLNEEKSLEIKRSATGSAVSRSSHSRSWRA